MLGDKANDGGGSDELLGMAEMGELRIERMRGITVDEARMWRGMLRAIHEHTKETFDQEANIGALPLTDGQAVSMMDSQGRVSGYRLVQIKEMLETSAGQFEALLAEKLSEGELEDLRHESVWAMGDVVMFYVSGVLRP